MGAIVPGAGGGAKPVAIARACPRYRAAIGNPARLRLFHTARLWSRNT